MELLLWACILYVVNLAVHIAFETIDLYEKLKSHNLIKLGKFRYLFTRHVKMIEKRRYIGKISFSLQIANWVIMMAFIVVICVNTFVWSSGTIGLCCLWFILGYGGVYLIVACIFKTVTDNIKK